MLLPALTKPKSRAQGVRCMSHLCQLSFAWMQYASDSNNPFESWMNLCTLHAINSSVQQILATESRMR